MIDSVTGILRMVIAILPFVLLCIVSKHDNLPKPIRSRQFFMPVMTVLYVIVSMLLMNRINEWILRFIARIPNRILALGLHIDFISYSYFENLALKADNFIKAVNFNFWVFFIANTLIILVYLIYKKIIISIMGRAVKNDSEFHARIAEHFYEYFSEKDTWCIKENFSEARGMLRVFYWSSVVISVILMLISSKFYYEGLIKAVFYPVFAILIVGELYFYIDGLTRDEYTGHILGEDEDAYKTVNYSLLRKFLRTVFGDKLLSEKTRVNNALDSELTTDDIIRELERSEDQKVVAFASYIKALNSTGAEIDHNYIKSSLDMLDGKSILFNNPFYNDLIPYAFYPMNRALLNHKKVLVILGRHAVEKDIEDWILRGIEAVTNIPFMWNTGVLTSEKQDLDIGIMTRSDVLDMELHDANSEFLENAGFIVIVEPSKLLSTAQIGLNLIVKKCRTEEDKNIVFCMCDKNCDGLVDAMSHVLMTSITEVCATKKPLGTSSYMCWQADSEYLHHRLVPNISRYLGLGTELSFAALKNQVSKAKWYGGEAFPVTDMRWIDSQYYYDLTKYAGIPTSQEYMDEHFITSSNFWSAEVEKNSYITAEDESFNMFEILRDFSTRTTEQGFVNIISSEYMLKDYMADNASIFEADAKAIPCIVADYTRSNRNVILRLILMMSTYPVKEAVIIKELSLLGISVFNLKKQLWFELYNCYTEVSKISLQPENYEDAVEYVSGEALFVEDRKWTSDIFTSSESFNVKTGRMENVYSISDPDFLKLCVSELRCAGYVAEDEKGEKYYLGSELAGHIYQKYLPGQFFTFGGKYYEMQYLTADGQVLIRRAADHITGRPAYRQMREYIIEGTKTSDKIGASKDISGIKVVREFADICVKTSGYYKMRDYKDFETAKCVLFEGEKTGIPDRIYKNKEILRINLPGADANVRYTVAVLFNEIFKTLFAENQAFICAVTDTSALGENRNIPLTYSLKAENCEINTDAVYIIEDSQLDLGLTVAVERNLQRIFSIMHDYLDWHLAALEESLNPTPEPQPPIVFSEDGDIVPPEKKGFFDKLKEKLKGIFSKKDKSEKKKQKAERKKKLKEEKKRLKEEKKKKKKGSKSEDGGINPEDKTPEDNIPEDKIPEDKTPENEIPEEKIPEDNIPENKEPEDETAEDNIPEDKQPEDNLPEDNLPENDLPDDESGDNNIHGDIAPGLQEGPYDMLNESVPVKDPQKGFADEKRPYHERYYMLYGSDTEPANINLTGTLDYLSGLGLEGNAMKQARNGKKIADYIEATFKPGKPDSRYCDFCGCEIYGVEYETLADGRDRCLNCGRTAIKTGDEFRKIFEDVKRNMETFFGIRINAGIRVEMINSKKLHKRLGHSFVPTSGSDGRILGVAIKDKNGFSLYVENGSPRMASMLTIAHELTHIWQYINWNRKAIRKHYGKGLELEIYEGMAKWVEIQYAYLINEPAIAKREEIITSYRDDEYGHGFLRYRANYPFSTGTVITKATPFMNISEPLAAEFCGPFSFVDNLPEPHSEDPDEDKGGAKELPISTGRIEGPSDRDPTALEYYAYSLLNEDEKKVYDLIVGAINRFEPSVALINSSIKDTQIEKINASLNADHPEIFWYNSGLHYTMNKADHNVMSIEFTYCLTPEERDRRQEKINMAVNSFMSSINDTMSDYEVTLHIFENIIKLVDYDTIGLERQKKHSITADKPDDLRNIYGVFVNKKAVCAGYAKALQYLLIKCGIECIYVVSKEHAWNLVKLEGDWYHIDVTWGDGSNTKAEKNSSDRVNYDCFCITDEDVSRLDSHKPEDIIPLPPCTATKCNYHHRHGLYFENYDYSRIRNIVCESVKRRKYDVSFRFSSEEVLETAAKDLVDGGKFREAIQYAVLKNGEKIDSSYVYSKCVEKLTLSFVMKKL